MRTYLLYFFACLRQSDINVKPIKKDERHHYSCAKVVFLFQKKRTPTFHTKWRCRGSTFISYKRYFYIFAMMPTYLPSGTWSFI